MNRREHMDVNRWGRVAREVREAQQPPAAPPPPPRRSAAVKYVEPTYLDRRAFEMSLARPCPRHGAEPGVLCFDGGGVRGLCATRTGTAAPPPSRRKEATA